MSIKEFREPMKSGIIKDKEYIGDVFQRGEVYVGTIMEVPPANGVAVFGEHVTATFDNYESAKQFVHNEWSKLSN